MYEIIVGYISEGYVTCCSPFKLALIHELFLKNNIYSSLKNYVN